MISHSSFGTSSFKLPLARTAFREDAQPPCVVSTGAERGRGAVDEVEVASLLLSAAATNGSESGLGGSTGVRRLFSAALTSFEISVGAHLPVLPFSPTPSSPRTAFVRRLSCSPAYLQLQSALYTLQPVHQFCNRSPSTVLSPSPSSVFLVPSVTSTSQGTSGSDSPKRQPEPTPPVSPLASFASSSSFRRIISFRGIAKAEVDDPWSHRETCDAFLVRATAALPQSLAPSALCRDCPPSRQSLEPAVLLAFVQNAAEWTPETTTTDDDKDYLDWLTLPTLS